MSIPVLHQDIWCSCDEDDDDNDRTRIPPFIHGVQGGLHGISPALYPWDKIPDPRDCPNPFQASFRPGCATETAPVTLVDDLR